MPEIRVFDVEPSQDGQSGVERVAVLQISGAFDVLGEGEGGEAGKVAG